MTTALREEILAKLRPTQDELERQQATIKNLTSVLESHAKEEGISYSFIQPQGSTGKKQTQLRGASDIDLFVALNPSDYENILMLPVKNRDIELDRIFELLIDNWFTPALGEIDASNLQKTYSQHPYLSATYLGNEVDILLCFDLPPESIAREGPITAVDRTIHHTDYVAKRLNSRLREDVRILKSFVHACHVYADTCAVGHMGFTGVSLELLVIEKGSLLGALKSLIELEKHPVDPLNREVEDLRRIPAFKDDFVFIIDPTDHNRNIASSFSKRSYTWLKNQTEHLLTLGSSDNRILDLVIEKPIPTTRPPEWIEKHLIINEFQAKKSIHYTIIRDKLHSFARKAAKELSHEGTGEKRFGKVAYEILFQDARFALGFIVENPKIPRTFTRRGPPADIPGAVEFKKTHSDSYESDGYLWVERRRRWVDADKLLDHLISTSLPGDLVKYADKTDIGHRVSNVLWQIIIPLENFPIEARV